MYCHELTVPVGWALNTNNKKKLMYCVQFCEQQTSPYQWSQVNVLLIVVMFCHEHRATTCQLLEANVFLSM